MRAGEPMPEPICPNCRHARRSHSGEGCGEDLEPISSGKRCKCKRKYMDGGWAQGVPRVG